MQKKASTRAGFFVPGAHSIQNDMRQEPRQILGDVRGILADANAASDIANQPAAEHRVVAIEAWRRMPVLPNARLMTIRAIDLQIMTIRPMQLTVRN